MKVKLLRDLVIRSKVAKAGEVVELPKKKAKYLISIGKAEDVKAKKEKVQVEEKNREKSEGFKEGK